jgi:hypothetical protein
MGKTVDQIERQRLRREMQEKQKEERRLAMHAIHIKERENCVKADMILNCPDVRCIEQRRLARIEKKAKRRQERLEISNKHSSHFDIHGFPALLQKLRTDRNCLLDAHLEVVSQETDYLCERNSTISDLKSFSIVCGENIETTSDKIIFALICENSEQRITFSLQARSFLYPTGLTQNVINEKVALSVEAVFTENGDEPLPSSLTALTNNLSVGQREGREQHQIWQQEVRNQHHRSYSFQQDQMKAVNKNKEILKWERILSSTGATRENRGNPDYIEALAERDVEITRGNLKGKYTNKSYKGFNPRLQAECEN